VSEERTELKPCPFCGAKPIVKWVGNDATKRRAVHICCSTFGCTIEMRVAAIRNDHEWCRATASEKWNTRVAAPEPTEQGGES
jgi:hypothetical protein